MLRLRHLLLAVALCAAAVPAARAFSFDLDSIAAMGRFPRFCVNTYHWGDRFFNGYDTTYVHGTGYRLNAKIRTESWTDYYRPHFSNGTEMGLISDPSTSLGLYLSYLAVSVGYDMNVSKYFGGSDRARQRWQFGFNCMLFSANAYFISNDVGTRIRYIRPGIGYGDDKLRPDYEFHDIRNSEWGISANYYFSHKRYSHAAAFALSRVQMRSAGSFSAGFSFFSQDYSFDFSSLPDDLKATLPMEWDGDYHYDVKTHNYLITVGYGYNWVFAPHWLLAADIVPMFGLTQGYIKYAHDPKTTFATMLNGELSLVWNNRAWFASLVGSADVSLIGAHERQVLTGLINFQVSLGYRFNI